tara:strand:+ start:368 stop:544 length:177 start_codon:yes stop_codon:yes gene_type:complete
MVEYSPIVTTVAINSKQLEVLKTIQKYMEEELHIKLNRSRVVERVLNLYLLEITREQS